MTSFHELCERIAELKSKGLSNREIADEFNIQLDTVVWLLLHDKNRKALPTPLDYSINWSNIGSSTRRLSLIGWALADLAKESVAKGEFEDFETVVGVEISTAPLGLVVADELGKSFAAIRLPRTEKKSRVPSGVITSSFSPVESTKVIVVADVISTDAGLKDVIKSLRENHATPVGIVTFVDKRGGGEIERVPVKSLINIISINK